MLMLMLMLVLMLMPMPPPPSRAAASMSGTTSRMPGGSKTTGRTTASSKVSRQTRKRLPPARWAEYSTAYLTHLPFLLCSPREHQHEVRARYVRRSAGKVHRSGDQRRQLGRQLQVRVQPAIGESIDSLTRPFGFSLAESATRPPSTTCSTRTTT